MLFSFSFLQGSLGLTVPGKQWGGVAASWLAASKYVCLSNAGNAGNAGRGSTIRRSFGKAASVEAGKGGLHHGCCTAADSNER